MTFLLWFLGIWFSLLLTFFATCAIGAYINFLRERFSLPEVLSTTTVKCPGTIVSVTLFYEPGPPRFHHMPQAVGPDLFKGVRDNQVSSRFTSYPCGI